MSKVVYLSPSTQDRNIGVGAYGTEEKRMNQVADVVESLLKHNGLIVYRNKPEWSLLQVVKHSNAQKPNVHVAIHSNAGGGEGCEVFAYKAKSDGEVLAKSIYKELEPLTPSKDRGVKFNPKLYELRGTKAAAVLIEVAFHDNREDALWIIKNIKSIGKAIAKGIVKYFGLAFSDSQGEDSEILLGNADNNQKEIAELLQGIKGNVDKITDLINL